MSVIADFAEPTTVTLAEIRRHGIAYDDKQWAVYEAWKGPKGTFVILHNRAGIAKPWHAVFIGKTWDGSIGAYMPAKATSYEETIRSCRNRVFR